jgi:hypothetical protein
MAYTSINAALHEAHARGQEHDRKRRIIPVHPPPPKQQTPIPRSLRSTIIQRVTNQARREFNPLIESLQRQKARLAPAYQRDLASAQGYVDLASQGIQDVSLKGLEGRYKSQVASELANRAADVEQSAPILAQEQTQEYRADRQSAQQDIIGARLDKQQAIAQGTASAFDVARTDLHGQALREETRARARNARIRADRPDAGPGGQRKADRADRKENQADFRKELALALHYVDQIIHSSDNAEQKSRLDDGTATMDDWSGLEQLVGQREGIGGPAAQRAIELTQQRFGY